MTHWYSREDEVVAFGRDLLRSGVIITTTGLQEYYEKPHAWQPEHDWWEQHGRTDNPDDWAGYDR